MNSVELELLQTLPRRVLGVEVQDPILTLYGEQWSLTVFGPWEGTLHGRTLVWEEDDLEDWSWDLIGQDLLTVREEDTLIRFEFSAGSLVVTSDSDWEPWVLRLPAGVLVGKTL